MTGAPETCFPDYGIIQINIESLIAARLYLEAKLRHRVAGLFLVILIASLRPVCSEICTIDNTPAATLLLPYFEVDLSGVAAARANAPNPPPKRTVVMTVNNAAGIPSPRTAGGTTAILAHVVIWSDLSVPVLDFNLYLTSYDVQTINLYDILALGQLPQTASVGQDPTDTISPQGAFSDDINFASCTGQLPPPDLPATFLAHLQAALTGKFSSILGGCAGLDHGDDIARGYITIDVVNNCTLRFPGDPGYFAPGGTGDATNQNVLWGDYFYVNTEENFAQGETLVHIETSATDPQTSTAGQYTFYGRYVAWTAADNREPLSTSFAVRYVTGGAFDGGTDLLIWRDSKVSQGPFTCPAVAGTRPPWYPLGQEGIVIFDEEENPEVPTTFPVSPQPPQASLIPFPAEAQRTQVNGPALPVTPDFGWLYLNLNTTVAVAGANPPVDPAAAQAWVTAVMDASGRFSVGFDAIQIDSACAANHAVPDEP